MSTRNNAKADTQHNYRTGQTMTVEEWQWTKDYEEYRITLKQKGENKTVAEREWVEDYEEFRMTLYLTGEVLGDKNASKEERNKNLIIRNQTIKEWTERLTK